MPSYECRRLDGVVEAGSNLADYVQDTYCGEPYLADADRKSKRRSRR